MTMTPQPGTPAIIAAEAIMHDHPADPMPERRPFNFGRWFRATGWRHVVGVIMVIFSVFPLLYVLSASLHPGSTRSSRRTRSSSMLGSASRVSRLCSIVRTTPPTCAPR